MTAHLLKRTVPAGDMWKWVCTCGHTGLTTSEATARTGQRAHRAQREEPAS